ncbi:MAG TPA: tetratricopeptide repeat protein [Flavobacteriales bacterium]|nr:tetratricopeptide repeat protein [Flavobacteriales bacterium]HQW85546.1 tetratricopeptide repeat protein [Flavobacteriales bacterium]
MRSLCSTLVIGLAIVASAQDASLVPGIRTELAAATNDTLRADALARLCFNLIHSDPDSARLCGDQALALATRIGNARARGDAHNNLGWLEAQQGHLDSADHHLDQALALFRKAGRREHIAVTLSNKGWVAGKRGDQVGALTHFLDALKYSEQARDTASTSILLYSIGIAYRKTSDHAQALDFLERSAALERVLGRTSKQANCAVAIGNTYRELGDTARALERLEQAATLYASTGDHQGLGLVAENRGDLLAPRDPAAALLAYGRARAHYDTLHSSTDLAYVLRSLGALLLRTGQVAEATEVLRTGGSLALGSGDAELRMNYALTLAELARVNGDADAVFEHLQRHLALKDSLQGADTQREIARLRTAFDTERKEKDNALLRAQNREQAERIRRDRQRLTGIAVIAALALIAALLFFLNYRQKRRHATLLEALNRKLADSNREITEINGLLELKLLRSQMNPHFIYNSLSSAARMTQAGLQVEALAYLQGFARLLRQVLDHSVDDRVSVEAEADFLRQYLKLEAVRLEGLTYSVEVDPVLLNDDAEVPALIVQPFVENAVLHGLSEKPGERRLAVRFERAGGHVRCTITDNGVGRNGAGAAVHGTRDHRSLGMQLTRERLLLLTRRLGGERSVHIEDLHDAGGASAGTRVTLLL